MAETRRSGGLHTIFSFFLGLMFTAFAGVGVYTFHPPPVEYDAQIKELDRREQEIMAVKPADSLTAGDREELQGIIRQRNELEDEAREARQPWERSTSIVLIICATLAMAVSLIRADRLPVISNGLLLGGVFTMLYGVGWIVATDTSVARFVVMTIALVITLALGYTRFVRVGSRGEERAEASASGAEGHAELETRLRKLEARMEEAARALGDGSD